MWDFFFGTHLALNLFNPLVGLLSPWLMISFITHNAACCAAGDGDYNVVEVQNSTTKMELETDAAAL